MGVLSRALCAVPLAATLVAGPAAASTVLPFSFVATEGEVTAVSNPPGGATLCRAYSATCYNIGNATIVTSNSYYLVANHPYSGRSDWANFRLDYRHSGVGGDQTFFMGFVFNGVVTHTQEITASADDHTFHLASVNFGPGDLGSGYLQFLVGSTDPNGPVIDGFSLNTQAVPEPQTWALLIVGFGLAGASLRSRRRVAW